MYLLDLPVEIGAIIFNNLDTKSKLNAYSIVELRHFFLPSIMTKFDVSLSSAASVKTLDLDMFQDYAANIKELNLSGIADLTADQLSQHIQRCSNLQTLDITFTSIYLSDLEDMCPVNLKNISVNFFELPRKAQGQDVWKKCIDHFQRQRFERVHFIVSSYDSDSPLFFMHEVPRTKSLKITVNDNYNRNLRKHYDRHRWSILNENSLDMENIINVFFFEKLIYVFRDHIARYSDHFTPYVPGVSNLDYNQIEYMFFKYSDNDRPSEEIKIYVSPTFISLFENFQMHCSDLKIEVSTRLPSNFSLGRDMVFKAWHKSFTKFNDAFFKTVLTELTDYFPTYVCMHNKMEMTLTQAPSNWFCIDACQGFERILSRLPEKVTLTNYCRKEGRLLPNTQPVYLTPSNTLKNVTFLRLSNICLRGDFFTVLFNQCKHLYTLDVYIKKRDFKGCSLSLPNSMHLAENLKNMTLTSADIEYETLLVSLCQCRKLENIHIIEYKRTLEHYIDQEIIVLLINKCLGLYSLIIETNMQRKFMTSLTSHLRETAQRLKRDSLFIEVGRDIDIGWNPFSDVFNPSPLNIFS